MPKKDKTSHSDLLPKISFNDLPADNKIRFSCNFVEDKGLGTVGPAGTCYPALSHCRCQSAHQYSEPSFFCGTLEVFPFQCSIPGQSKEGLQADVGQL